LFLVCEEESTYHQGTDVRTERRVVHRHSVFCQQSLKLDPMQPFEFECRFAVPDAVMHSFRSRHNAVQWKLMVQGEALSCLTVIRTFPVVVYPALGASVNGTVN
jgi:hypothetical protein